MIPTIAKIHKVYFIKGEENGYKVSLEFDSIQILDISSFNSEICIFIILFIDISFQQN